MIHLLFIQLIPINTYRIKQIDHLQTEYQNINSLNKLKEKKRKGKTIICSKNLKDNNIQAM